MSWGVAVYLAVVSCNALQGVSGTESDEDFTVGPELGITASWREGAVDADAMKRFIDTFEDTLRLPADAGEAGGSQSVLLARTAVKALA